MHGSDMEGQKEKRKDGGSINKLQEMIVELEENVHRSDLEDKLLQALKNKEQAIGEDTTDEQIEEEIGQVIMEQMIGMLTADTPDSDPESNPDLEDSIQVVRKVFADKDLHYQEYQHQKGVRAFMLNMTSKGRKLHVKVYLEAFPKVCRIDAIYPFVADAALVYPLCEKMLQENYPRRFGALQYDSRDGELSYRYSFPITHGLHEDDFRTVLMAVLATADSSFEAVRQFAVGRFRKPQRDEIISKAQRLIIELDQ